MKAGCFFVGIRLLRKFLAYPPTWVYNMLNWDLSLPRLPSEGSCRRRRLRGEKLDFVLQDW